MDTPLDVFTKENDVDRIIKNIPLATLDQVLDTETAKNDIAENDGTIQLGNFGGAAVEYNSREDVFFVIYRPPQSPALRLEGSIPRAAVSSWPEGIKFEISTSRRYSDNMPYATFKIGTTENERHRIYNRIVDRANEIGSPSRDDEEMLQRIFTHRYIDGPEVKRIGECLGIPFSDMVEYDAYNEPRDIILWEIDRRLIDIENNGDRWLEETPDTNRRDTVHDRLEERQTTSNIVRGGERMNFEVTATADGYHQSIMGLRSATGENVIVSLQYNQYPGSNMTRTGYYIRMSNGTVVRDIDLTTGRASVHVNHADVERVETRRNGREIHSRYIKYHQILLDERHGRNIRVFEHLKAQHFYPGSPAVQELWRRMKWEDTNS